MCNLKKIQKDCAPVSAKAMTKVKIKHCDKITAKAKLKTLLMFENLTVFVNFNFYIIK